MKSEPERISRVGLILLGAVLVFAAAAHFYPSVFARQLDRLLGSSRAPDPAPVQPTVDPDSLPLAIPAAALTQAWFLDASGYDGAAAEQKRTGAPLLIFFHKRACEPCRQVEHQLLASPEVKRYLEGAVRVRVDVSSGPREDQLAAKFQVSALPALVAISPSGAARPINLERGGLLLSPAQVVAQLQ